MLAVFELVLFLIIMILILRDQPVHYFALYAIQKVLFIIKLLSLGPRNEHYNEVAMYD